MASEIAPAGQVIAAQESTAASAVVAQVLTDLGISPTPTPSVPQPIAESWEVKLARSAASRLRESIPHKTSRQLADELLQRLLEKRGSREAQNLNHWSEYAPGYLDKLVRSLANAEAWRRRKIAAFFEANYERAGAFARRFLSAPEEIEEVVGTAFELLQAGRVDFKNFYPKLRDLCVNRLRRMEVERGLFVSLDGLIQDARRAEESLDDDLPGAAATAPKCWEQDPLSQLMDRRNRRAKPLMVGRAKKSPKMRRARRAQWVAEIENPRPKSPAQTDS